MFARSQMESPRVFRSSDATDAFQRCMKARIQAILETSGARQSSSAGVVHTAEFDDVPPVGGRLSPHPGRRLRHRTSEWDPPQTVVSPLGERTAENSCLCIWREGGLVVQLAC